MVLPFFSSVVDDLYIQQVIFPTVLKGDFEGGEVFLFLSRHSQQNKKKIFLSLVLLFTLPLPHLFLSSNA
jgi:hypothetical protein